MQLQDSFCAGSELQFLSCRIGCMPNRLISGGSRLVKILVFLLYNRISHFVGSSARTLYLRIFVSVWLVTGFVAQSPDQKVFNKKTQATDIYQICSTAVGSCFITGAYSKWFGDGRPIFLQIYMSARCAWGCVATFGSQRRYPFGIGTTVFVETCCADFSSRFERAVLQTVLQMDLPTRCILCTVQQGFAVWDEGRRAQMRFVR